MVDKYVSCKTVINKAYRDTGYTSDINEAHVIEWIGETLDKVGAFSQYKQIKECLDLTNGIAKLPVNFYKIVDLTFNNIRMTWANNDINSDYACEGCTIQSCCGRYNFYIAGGNIITDIKPEETNREGQNSICITYLGIPVDSDGYPLVPDDPYYIDVCVKYITYMMDYREWRKGNIPDKIVSKSETDYLWAVGAAKGSGNMPNKFKMDKIMNVWVRLIPNMNGMNNEPERIIRH